MIYLFLALYAFVEFVWFRKSQTIILDKWNSKALRNDLMIQIVGSFLFLLWFIPMEFGIWIMLLFAIGLKIVMVALRLFTDSKITEFRGFKRLQTDQEKENFMRRYIQIRYIVYHVIGVYLTLAVWSEIKNGNDYVRRSIIDSAVDGSTSIYILGFIILSIVGNQVFKIYFSQYSAEKEEDKDQLNTGALIGSMERMTMMALLIAGQWIGLTVVIAAKSIARFKQLEDKKFSEYYLIGTLYSVIFVVVTYYLFIESIFA